MKRPDNTKMLEWLIQLVAITAVGYGSYKVMELKVDLNTKSIENISSDLKNCVTKDEFREYKRFVRDHH